VNEPRIIGAKVDELLSESKLSDSVIAAEVHSMKDLRISICRVSRSGVHCSDKLIRVKLIRRPTVIILGLLHYKR